jgi:hypothetical protein
MTTRIAYNSSNGIGQKAAEFIQQVQETIAKGRRLKASLDAMSYGDDWDSIEAEVGGMAQGSGEAFWSIISTAMQSIDTAQVAELCRLDKG